MPIDISTAIKEGLQDLLKGSSTSETATTGNDLRAKNEELKSQTAGWMPTYKSYPISPSGQTVTSSWQPSGTKPTFGAIPQFTAPEWDEQEIEQLTQRKAAPGIRQLREAVQSAMRKPYSSPQVQRMTLRDALQGYGIGLESVLGGAGQAAIGEYGQKYGREFAGEQMNWQAEANRLNTIYQGAMQEYMGTGTQTQTSKATYGDDTGNEKDLFGNPLNDPRQRPPVSLRM